VLRQARRAQAALVDGAPGVVVAVRGRPRFILRQTVRDERIVAIEAVADPDAMGRTDLVVVGPSSR
jgi:RNA polymerase sigma-70 factor (ECF subfamily)